MLRRIYLSGTVKGLILRALCMQFSILHGCIYRNDLFSLLKIINLSKLPTLVLIARKNKIFSQFDYNEIKKGKNLVI